MNQPEKKKTLTANSIISGNLNQLSAKASYFEETKQRLGVTDETEDEPMLKIVFEQDRETGTLNAKKTEIKLAEDHMRDQKEQVRRRRNLL